MESNLSAWKMQLEEKEESLKKYKKDSVDAKNIYKYEVFETLLRDTSAPWPYYFPCGYI